MPAITPAIPAVLATATAHPLVLLVDDDDDSRTLCAEHLEAAGYRIVQAVDGREGVTRARELLPDVVLTDMSLPIVDGCEATRQLKGDPRTARIPVIVLTGYDDLWHMHEAQQAGCDSFLIKPCTPATLLAAVGRHVASA